MLIFLSLALYFVFAGGQIAVLITEFLQGIFANAVFLVLIVLLLFIVDWKHIYEALSLAPKDASLLNDFGLCYAERKMYNEAIQMMEQAIRLEPQNPLSRAWLSTTRMCPGRTSAL